MTPFLQSAGWVLIHFVWQGAAIALVAAVALRVTERRSPNTRYVIGCVALTVMLAAPALTLRLPRSADADAGLVASGAAAASGQVTANVPLLTTTAPRVMADGPGSRMSASPAFGVSAFRRTIGSNLNWAATGIAVAWLLGVIVLLGRMAGGWWHVRRLHRVALATASSRWQTASRRLAYRLGLPAAAHVVESALVDVPTVVGWLRPAILLPVAALASLTPAQVEAILAHELAHIRRHDYALNVLQTIAETLLFYHPAVWWVSNRIRVEREHCCDEIAVAVCGDPISYAQALAELESWRSLSTALAMAATGGSLLDRIRRILRVPIPEEPRSPSWAVTLALTLVFAAGAGSVQHLPWVVTRGDARAEAPVRSVGVPAQPARPSSTAVPVRPTTALLEQDRFEIPQPPQPPPPPQPPQSPQPPQPPQPPQAPQFSAPQHPEPPQPPFAARWGYASAPPLPPVPPVPPTAPMPPVPPMPPMAPLPPLPSEPPTPPSPPAPGDFLVSHGQSQRGSRGSEWRMQFSDNGTRLDVTLRGTITFTDDLTDVQSLSDDGIFTMRDWSHVVPRTVEITSPGGKLTRSYYIGGLSRPWNEEARQFLATQLPLLVRRSGLGADARVKSIFEKKGVNGVLEEIDLLGGDSARRLYFTALLDVAHLDSNGVTPVLARVGQRMTSDYDRRVVLEQVAAQVTLDRAGAAAYIQAMASMKSDYDQREALSALVKRHGAVVDGDAMVAAVGHMKSSYDKRMVLADVIGRGALSLDSKKSVLLAAASMASDYDRAQVLTAYVQSYGVEAPLGEPFFAAVRSLDSDYERRRVLTELAKKSAVGRDVQQSAFELVSAMSSDYDRAEVLLAFVSSQGIDSVNRPAFVSAAERLKSSYDQNRVLAALVRSERR